MYGDIGRLAKGSIVGLPPRVVYDLAKKGVDATNHLDNRGAAEFTAIQEVEQRQKDGCLGYMLELPVFRQVREALPQRLKDMVKQEVRHMISDDLIEP